MALPSAGMFRLELCKRLEENGFKHLALQMFHSLSSDEARVETCFWLIDICKAKPPMEIRPPSSWIKSDREAMALRNKGNEEFAAKEYVEALLSYTKSIAASPAMATEENPETKCLSLAFANRSAAFWQLGKYNECIEDIDTTLHLRYPQDLKSKLYLRRGKCEKMLGSTDAAKESFLMALRFLELSPNKRIEKEINNWLKDVTETVTQFAGSSFTVTSDKQRLPLLKNGGSKKILSASDCVDIAYLPSMGRYLIATKPIDPGDVLVIDKPYSTILFQDYYFTHCYHCLKRSLLLIPCFNCTKVMFCSTDCRQKGMRDYHIMECQILPYMHQMKVGRNGFLAMKTVLKLFLSEDYLEVRRKILKEANLEESLRGFNDGGAYNALNYNAIFWLVTNAEQKLREEIFENAMLASYMVEILEAYTPFFNTLQVQGLVNSGLKDIKNIFGTLLLRHLHNFASNAHSVVETIKSSGNSTEDVVEIGAAVYGTLSLINHSCNPNVGRFSHNGDTGVLRAIKSITPGEQLFDNYGYHYSLMDKETRRRHLLYYYQFRCNCQACCEEWPIYSLQPSGTPTYTCHRCKAALNASGGCSRCGEKQNLTKIERYLQHSSEKIERIIINLQDGTNISEEDVLMLIKHLKVLDLNVKLPWQKYCGCQEALKHYFSKTGNYFAFSK